MNSPLENIYWLALMDRIGLLPNIKIEGLLRKGESIECLWDLPSDGLSDLGLNDKEIAKVVNFRKSVKLERYSILQKILSKEEIRICRYNDEDYPLILKNFADYNVEPPLGLFIKGSIGQIGEGVAIVGTRNCSFYGHSMARKMAKEIAGKGHVIISGLARGVDTEAHCGALEASQGKTIAILPWMSRIYPKENVNLARDIIEKGAIVSEHYWPPREGPSKLAKVAFVLRNRIISGLSRCVILIESAEGGGTFRQATIAIQQGRKVFALKPRQKNKEANKGFEMFVKMGATPIVSAKPVLEYLRFSLSTKTEEKRIDFYRSRNPEINYF